MGVQRAEWGRGHGELAQLPLDLFLKAVGVAEGFA